MSYDPDLALFIDGRTRAGEGRAVHEVLNPATGAVIGRLPLATTQDLNDALDAAQRGFRAWRATAPDVRAGVLLQTAALIRRRADRLAQIATLEQGKILTEARGEALAAAAMLEFHAGETMRIYGRVLPRPSGMRSMVLHQPVGPVAAFCAWNFPLLNVVRKIAPAVAAGCSIILKPSEETPGSAIEILRCFLEAGLPGDVAQLVFGEPDAVSTQLLASPVTRKLSFTGSVAVGKHLTRLAAGSMMRTTMELGGHAPVLVFDDCDLESALDLLVAHKFRNAGQVCVAPTRFYVEETIHDRFVAGFAERARALSIGDGSRDGVQMGPMANARRQAAIEAMVEDARHSGGRVLTGGDRLSGAGFFFAPTVIANAPPEAKVTTEEPFGPLALVAPFSGIDQAIELANGLPFGLAAYAFTENGRRQNRLAEEIEAGMVAINSVRMTWPDSPFGGVKDSGYGSEDGPEGVAAHLVTKAVHIA